MELVQRIEGLEETLFQLVIKIEALKYDFVECALVMSDMKVIIEDVYLIKKNRINKKKKNSDMDVRDPIINKTKKLCKDVGKRKN
jgi:hypothetical protein